jgi:hypothetical protein
MAHQDRCGGQAPALPTRCSIGYPCFTGGPSAGTVRESVARLPVEVVVLLGVGLRVHGNSDGGFGAASTDSGKRHHLLLGGSVGLVWPQTGPVSMPSLRQVLPPDFVVDEYSLSAMPPLRFAQVPGAC